uniref:Retrotransposon gag domain-containing protein n=1 Tax=Setaria italica TaxID=4555 RepID=K3ZMU2_SETIT
CTSYRCLQQVILIGILHCEDRDRVSSFGIKSLCCHGRMYTKLPFYGSIDSEEFLDWEEQMEHELELQDFPKAKKVSRARIRQGGKSVQSYHDELSCAMCRANIVDDMDAKEYIKRGLNPNIAAAIEGKYARSVQNLLVSAIKEERKIKELQQDTISWYIICAKASLQADIDGSTKIVGVPLPLEVGKARFNNESAHALAAPNIDVQVVQQNPRENESHIAKLTSTMSERYTPHKKRELDCKTCENVYKSNPLIPTSSVVSQSVQVCKKIEQEMVAHHTTPLDVGSEKIATYVQLITHTELFAKLSPTECLCYTMLRKPIEIDQMLKNISMITSMRSLNNAHSCKFTFNLICEHFINKFFVCAICITCDKLVDF